MIKEILELPVAALERGMYVARLDRPWTETPFLFQGFRVDDEQELTLLRDLCKTVYVEVGAEEADLLRLTAAKAIGRTKRSVAADPLQVLSNDITAFRDRVPIKDAVDLRTELTQAATTFSEAQRAINTVFEHLRQGGALDLPHLQSVVGSMVDSIFRNRDAMGWLVRMKSKDQYLYHHSIACSVWALALGRHLGLDKKSLASIGTGAMLLDIGKTTLPMELLQKAGPLTAQEWKLMRTHAEKGVEMVRTASPADPQIVSMISSHHERFDGSGYPHGLKNEGIPLLGRIAGIVDSYDAMISERSYAKPKSNYDAVRELKRLENAWFQTELVELFIQAVGVFPNGTLVELNTGEVAVVVGQNHFRRLRPVIMLILDAQKKVYPEFTNIDLLTCEQNVGSALPTLWITKGLDPGAYGVDPREYFL